MGPIIHVLLSNYGLHGTFLILCGICLNGIVFGLLIPNKEDFPKNDVEKCNEPLAVGKKNFESTDLKELSHSEHIQKEGTTTTSTVVKKDTASETSPLVHHETNGYLRLLKNIHFIMYSTGSILHFIAMKAVISKLPFF